MKKTLAVLLFVVAGAFLCGNALALDTYIPHITTGANDWTDYLQVNNNASSTASFTLYLYDGSGAQIYNQTHSVGARSRSQIALKTLNPNAAAGKITYTEAGLIFRVSYESVGGGVAEFMTIDTLGSNIGFCFSDFSTLVQWKGAAIANMGTTAADVTLHALGGSTQGSGGSILETHTETIAPKAKLVGNNMNFAWLSGLDLDQIESIIAVTGSSSLCGIAISGNTALSSLLFTPAAAVSNFNPQAETWDISATVNCGGAFPVTADMALTIAGTTFTAVITTKVIGGAAEVHLITLTGTYDSTTRVGTVPSQVFTVAMSTGTETVTMSGQFQINGAGTALTATGNMTVVGPGSAWTCSGTLTATGTK